jgi:MFS family permease
MNSKVANSYTKIPADVREKVDPSEPLSLSRPNEKYGAIPPIIHNPAAELEAVNKAYVTYGIIGFSVLIGDMARGILFPTMFLFILSFNGSRASEGYALASFSAGRVLSTPIFGKLADILGHRKVLILCNIILAVGCLFYTRANELYWLNFAYILMGIGSGSLGVTRSFVAEKCERKDRTVQLSRLG